MAASQEGSAVSLADLGKLVYPLRAGYYSPEHAADAAKKLVVLLEADRNLYKQLPAALRTEVTDHLLTEDDEDIAYPLLKLVRKLRHIQHAIRPETVDARVLDGATSRDHWSLHVWPGGDRQCVWAQFHDSFIFKPGIQLQSKGVISPAGWGNQRKKHAWAINLLVDRHVYPGSPWPTSPLGRDVKLGQIISVPLGGGVMGTGTGGAVLAIWVMGKAMSIQRRSTCARPYPVG